MTILERMMGYSGRKFNTLVESEGSRRVLEVRERWIELPGIVGGRRNRIRGRCWGVFLKRRRRMVEVLGLIMDRIRLRLVDLAWEERRVGMMIRGGWQRLMG